MKNVTNRGWQTAPNDSCTKVDWKLLGFFDMAAEKEDDCDCKIEMNPRNFAKCINPHRHVGIMHKRGKGQTKCTAHFGVYYYYWAGGRQDYCKDAGQLCKKIYPLARGQLARDFQQVHLLFFQSHLLSRAPSLWTCPLDLTASVYRLLRNRSGHSALSCNLSWLPWPNFWSCHTWWFWNFFAC